jgi:hypothetical protein
MLEGEETEGVQEVVVVELKEEVMVVELAQRMVSRSKVQTPAALRGSIWWMRWISATLQAPTC